MRVYEWHENGNEYEFELPDELVCGFEDLGQVIEDYSFEHRTVPEALEGGAMPAQNVELVKEDGDSAVWEAIQPPWGFARQSMCTFYAVGPKAKQLLKEVC